MNKKQLYEAPEAEVLVVKIEENFCGTNPNGLDYGTEVSPFGPNRSRAYYYDDEEDF